MIKAQSELVILSKNFSERIGELRFISSIEQNEN